MPNITKHEEDCLYRPVQCPDLKCNKKIPFIGVLDHIEECLDKNEMKCPENYLWKIECGDSYYGSYHAECRILAENHFLST